ncbi:MAG TPA: protein kinase family protein, partial [Streptomyces sp.]|nr:protein kinase family protein [Streptomyces sp.]
MGVRRGAYGAVSTELGLRSDRALRELLEAAEPLGTGIGGRSGLLEISGTPVFVKRVPVTEPELSPGNVHSTANLFGLPMFCQYGIGGPSFGAWRELAVHVMTTNWVLAGEHDGFPLLYHWRVLPDPLPSLPDELADVDRAVADCGGRPQVRQCIEALRDAPASLVLFLEYIPQTLPDWLTAQLQAGDETADQAIGMVERELQSGLAFMNARGLLHFDAHFHNILTDGRRLYFTDYGLALSSRFDLTAD